MNWEQILEVKLETLGVYPTEDQLLDLSGWICENVPAASWGAIAFHLPAPISTEFSMRAGELGYH